MATPKEDGTDRLFLVEFYHDVLTVVPLGDFDSFCWPEMEEASRIIFRSLRSESGTKVLVDMSRTRQCGSALLGIMLKVWKSISPQKGMLAFCNLSEEVADVLKQTRLDTLWTLYPSRDAAYSAMRASTVGTASQT